MWTVRKSSSTSRLNIARQSGPSRLGVFLHTLQAVPFRVPWATSPPASNVSNTSRRLANSNVTSHLPAFVRQLLPGGIWVCVDYVARSGVAAEASAQLPVQQRNRMIRRCQRRNPHTERRRSDLFSLATCDCKDLLQDLQSTPCACSSKAIAWVSCRKIPHTYRLPNRREAGGEMTRENEPTASEALAHARDDINEAREAFMRSDGHRQAQYARSAINSATTILVDPGATPREVFAAHSFLREALALDGRPNTCGAESIDTVREASTLPPEDQTWLQNYLASRRPPTQQSSATADLGTLEQRLRGRGAWNLAGEAKHGHIGRQSCLRRPR